MKIEFFKKISLFAVMSASVAFLSVSCSKVDDLYKSSGPEGEGLLSDVDVSASFDWSTSKVLDVRLAVDDKFNGQYLYKLEIFDREPESLGATLLGAGSAKQGQDFLTKIAVPAGLAYIYVQETTPTGEKSYSMIEVAGKQSVVRSGKSAAVSKVAGVAKFANNKSYSRSSNVVVPQVPTNAVEIEGKKMISYADVSVNKNYVIRKGKFFNGDIALNAGVQGITVYVEGTWNHPESTLTLGAGNTIIVLPEAVFNVQNFLLPSTAIRFANYGTSKFNSFSASSQSNISNHGELTIANAFDIPSQSIVENTGVLKAKDMKINSEGQFVNKGEVTLTGMLDMPSGSIFTNKSKANIVNFQGNSSAVITNNGELRIEDAKITNTTWFVNCRTFIDNMNLNGAVFNIATGGRLDVEEFKSGGSTFNLANGAILDVTDKAEFTSNSSTVSALGDVAVARFAKVNLDGWNSVVYKGNLTVATNNHPTNGQYETKYTAEQFVKIVKYKEITVTIIGTECNGGGFNYKPTNPPIDQKPEAIELGTFSYAFEDNWPSKGDYDMNDLVVNIQIVKYQDKDNKVEKVVLKNKIRAVGASKRLAAAVQLDNVLAGAVKSVTYSKADLVNTVLPLGSNGVEQGQSKAIVTIVDDAHKAFGRTDNSFIYTHNGTTPPLETEITIVFNTPLDNFTYNDLNVFIINFAQMAGGRHEVHMVGYSPTDKVNAEVIRREQKDGMLSVSDPFKTKRNYPFALRFPVEFQYPLEGQSIKKAYPLFTDWVKSAGQSNQFWYNRTK